MPSNMRQTAFTSSFPEKSTPANGQPLEPQWISMASGLCNTSSEGTSSEDTSSEGTVSGQQAQGDVLSSRPRRAELPQMVVVVIDQPSPPTSLAQ